MLCRIRVDIINKNARETSQLGLRAVPQLMFSDFLVDFPGRKGLQDNSCFYLHSQHNFFLFSMPHAYCGWQNSWRDLGSPKTLSVLSCRTFPETEAYCRRNHNFPFSLNLLMSRVQPIFWALLLTRHLLWLVGHRASADDSISTEQAHQRQQRHCGFLLLFSGKSAQILYSGALTVIQF